MSGRKKSYIYQNYILDKNNFQHGIFDDFTKKNKELPWLSFNQNKYFLMWFNGTYIPIPHTIIIYHLFISQRKIFSSSFEYCSRYHCKTNVNILECYKENMCTLGNTNTYTLQYAYMKQNAYIFLVCTNTIICFKHLLNLVVIS